MVRLLLRRIIFGIAVGLISAPAVSAYSGAEFLSGNVDFADGFAFGALSYRLGVAGDGEEAEAIGYQKCFSDAGVTSKIFGNAVRNYINAHPEALTAPALGAALKTAIAMCPPQ